MGPYRRWHGWRDPYRKRLPLHGYYNRSDLTRKALIDGWYHTGDLGFVSMVSSLWLAARRTC